jgi:hypothetical protein
MYGSIALAILIAMQAALTVIDLAILAMSILVTGRSRTIHLAFLIPGFSFFNGYVMKSVRLLAYFQEVFLSSSRHDNYVPARVRSVRSW